MPGLLFVLRCLGSMLFGTLCRWAPFIRASVLTLFALGLNGCREASEDYLWADPEQCSKPFDSGVDACIQVRVADGTQLMAESRLTLILPNADESVTAKKVARVPRGFSPDAWEGRISGDDFSNVSISIVGSAISGAITAGNGRIYRVHGYRNSAKIESINLFLWTKSVAVELQPGVGTCQLEGDPEKYVCANSSKERVDVLVVFTPSALVSAGGVEAILASIGVAESRTNQSFIQSGADARIRVVRREVVNYQEVLSSEENLKRLVAGTHGLDRVHELRKVMKADLVVLIVDALGSNSLACPFPKNGKGSSSFASSAFAVVPVNSLLTLDHFAHEIGHLFGAGHATSDSGAFPYSHGYSPVPQPASGPWNTIMIRGGCTECAPILFWSNTTVGGIGGGPMGIKDEFDNARTISETACTLASFR